MGHYASDMPGWDEHRDAVNKAIALRERLNELPLNAFLVQDLPLLNRLYAIDTMDSLSEQEQQQLVARAEAYEAKVKRKAKTKA